MPSIFEKYQLKQVINASGRMTALGVSTPRPEVIDAAMAGMNQYFEMKDLVNKTGEYIAKLLEVEGATVVSCASAGLAQSVAAVLVQDSDWLLENLHVTPIENNEIVLPKGHNVNFGAPVGTMVALGGGKLVEAGYANECSAAQLAAAITPRTAAILYIKSHHCVQKSMLSVEQAAVVARTHNLPLIVDAAAEEDLQCYYRVGADLVIYSGAKAIEGPTSGLVIGKTQYVEWVKRQSAGIGRAMKVGKEGIVGLTCAIELYLRAQKESGAEMVEKMAPFIDTLNTFNGVSARVVWDSAGRDIARTEIKFDEAVTGIATGELVDALKQGEYAIYFRGYKANEGIIEADVRSVDRAQLAIVARRIGEVITGEKSMKLTPNFYRDRVCLNVLAGSKDNAREIYAAAEGHVLVGVLSKNYPDVASAVTDMREYAALIDNALSVGLGAGDPNQSAMVSEISRQVQPQHVNQVFTGVGASRALLGQNETVVNGLVSPTGTPGLVKISTGPLSSRAPDGIVPIETAIALLKDMGGSSVKYFPMGGLTCRDEYKAVADACARHDFWLEPTGGIDLENFAEILHIALDAGVSKIIPHIYSSIIDKVSGNTRADDVRQLLAIVRSRVG
ncbi:DgaE family pyridoxal phosphate-dependent ammonia lyase [Salmonella enterica]|nr:DgaE family pyridoxal phosphate-dependent ammonia lyase [Salmonella enterica]